MTPTEALVWEHLRDRKLYGLKFRRQINHALHEAQTTPLRPKWERGRG